MLALMFEELRGEPSASMTPPRVVIDAATAGLWAEISPEFVPRSSADAPAEPVPGASLGRSLDASLAKLAEVTSELASFRFADLAEPLVKEAVVALDGCRNRLDATVVHALGVVDARDMWAGDGARSTAGWVAAHTEAARGAASREVRLGRSLRTMPETDAAFSSGALGAAKAGLLADAARHAPEVFAADEAGLVDKALGLRVDQATKMLEFWKNLANPDDAVDDQERKFQARSVFVSQTLDGMWRLDGLLPAEMGEILAGELDRRTRAMYQADKAAADANGTPIERSSPQRRADALLELALQAKLNGDGATINTPAITAVIHVERITDPDTAPGDPVGQSEHGHPVTKATAERLLCDCAMSRVVLDADSVPVDLGVTARLPSPAQRRALAARDGGCTFPGCDRPPGWTQAHHVTHWINNGPTNLHNLTLLCHFHHHRVHEGGFGATRAPDGTLTFTRPDGTTITVPKGRHTATT
jgi:hypothetical protein